MARAIMVQGTMSHVGKSVLCTALCRILRQDGWRVAPFKSQNMALNSYVTPDGKEIGRAQGIQALAAGAVPSADMNPILLKPKGGMVSQVILLGRPAGDMTWRQYREAFYPTAREAVAGALARLQAAYDVLVIEGAGSPAEVNLKDRDLANMVVAAMAGAPVILVADIDRGGAFAQVVGTLECLDPEERDRVAGVVINKLRGDPSLLRPGVEWLERRTGKPVLGVVPWLPDLGIDEEDSVALSERGGALAPGGPAAGAGAGALDIAVIRLPHISNYTDFDPLTREPGVAVRYVERAQDLGYPDAVILPGTKNTVADLQFLYERGLVAAVARLAGAGTPIAGICGGYQMLGVELLDPDRVEGDRDHLPGLGLLPVRTVFLAHKVTRQVSGRTADGLRVEGYEIHMGRTEHLPGAQPLLYLDPDGRPDGAVAAGGQVWGTYLHGIFDNPGFRRRWLNHLRQRRGWPPLPLDGSAAPDLRELAFDRLAAHVRRHLDMGTIYRLLGLSAPPGAAGEGPPC